jgi:hypothetical protein
VLESVTNAGFCGQSWLLAVKTKAIWAECKE